VYGFLKRPKLSEVTSILMWLGIGLGVAFVCAIGFVVYASVS
jgi:FtsH-binding integral membrane protein